MRFQAIFAAMLVLLTGTLRYCPACDRAELEDRAGIEQSTPPDPHACCHKATPESETTQPADAPDSDSSPLGGDCARERVGLTLQAAVSGDLVTMAALPFALPSAPAAELPVSNVSAVKAEVPTSTMPPPLAALPLRI